MFDVTAYGDESEMVDAVYIVAGYIAPRGEWQALTSPWNEALAAEGLREFKMSACQGQDARQRRFLDLIAAHDLHGCVSVIDLRSYSAVAEDMKRKRAAGYWKAYFLAFQQELEMMCTYQAVRNLPSDERVDFSFDEHEEYQGRAQQLFESVRQADPSHVGDWIHRLGRLEYERSEMQPGLQAADALAYEAMRHFRDVVLANRRDRVRWQWQALPETGRFYCRVFTDDAIAELLRRLPDRVEPPRDKAQPGLVDPCDPGTKFE